MNMNMNSILFQWAFCLFMDIINSIPLPKLLCVSPLPFSGHFVCLEAFFEMFPLPRCTLFHILDKMFLCQ